MSTVERDQLMLSIKTPETEPEARKAMELLNTHFDGGFHPDDPIRDVADSTGEQYFGEVASRHYDIVIGMAYVLLEDIYQVALDLFRDGEDDE